MVHYTYIYQCSANNNKINENDETNFCINFWFTSFRYITTLKQWNNSNLYKDKAMLDRLIWK